MDDNLDDVDDGFEKQNSVLICDETIYISKRYYSLPHQSDTKSILNSTREQSHHFSSSFVWHSLRPLGRPLRPVGFSSDLPFFIVFLGWFPKINFKSEVWHFVKAIFSSFQGFLLQVAVLQDEKLPTVSFFSPPSFHHLSHHLSHTLSHFFHSIFLLTSLL